MASNIKMFSIARVQRVFPYYFSQIHTSSACYEIQKTTRLRVVDNSEIGKKAMAEGRPPKCIHVYNKTG